MLLRESPAAAGTPKLSFREGYCNLCERCMQVCPTGALVPIGKDEIRLGIAGIDEETCIAFKRSGCKICVKKCPEDAIIAVRANELIIDEAKCNGCGLCENVCPVGRPKLFNFAERRAIVIRRLEPGESAAHWRRA